MGKGKCSECKTLAESPHGSISICGLRTLSRAG